jgi:hypothetical protein
MTTITSANVDEDLIRGINNGLNNHHDIEHTVDYAMWDVGRLTSDMFQGKDTRGIGLGGPDDPISVPYGHSEGVFPSVNNANDQSKSFFASHRDTLESLARTSAPLSSTRNDVMFWNLHPMDYDPHPAVGHRHADVPDLDDPAVFDRIIRGAPSDYMKRQLTMTGPGDMDVGFRRTVSYGGRQYQRHRPLLRRSRNSDINEAVYGQGVTSSIASELGVAAPASRIDVRAGMRMTRDMLGFGEITDGVLYNRESISTTKSSFGYAQYAAAQQRDHSVAVAQIRRDNVQVDA